MSTVTLKGTGYFFKGCSSIKFDPTEHSLEELLADGWREYDPVAPAEPPCFGTLLSGKVVCRHRTSWWCPRAVAAMIARFGRRWSRAQAKAEAFP